MIQRRLFDSFDKKQTKNCIDLIYTHSYMFA